MNAISLSRMARLTQGVLLTGVACAALSGCISLAPKVPNQLLSLTPAHSAPSGDLASASLKDALVITEPDADRSLDVMRVPVRLDNSSIAYLKDASWMEKPTREFRDLLAETIRASSGKLVVVDSDFEEPGQTVLSGRLLNMGYVAATQTVVVRYDAILNKPGADVVTRRFEASVPNVEAKATAVGPAINTAANQVAQQVADWMKTQG